VFKLSAGIFANGAIIQTGAFFYTGPVLICASVLNLATLLGCGYSRITVVSERVASGYSAT